MNAVPIRTFELARGMAESVPTDGAFAGVPFMLKNIGSFWVPIR